MKIVVCIKRVPDTETRIRVSDDGRSIDTSGVKFVTSPYDEFALEAALRTREDAGEGEIVAVTIGDGDSRENLRSALAMGVDRGILLEGRTTHDGLATAKCLSTIVEELDPDLILLGVKAVDDDQQQTGPMLATLQGRGCATGVSEFRLDGDAFVCRREVEGGRETVRLARGAVLTITKGAYEPRHTSLKGIMAARKKPIETRSAPDPTSRLEVRGIELPPEREGGRIVGEGPNAVPELVRLLREEAGVI